MRKKHIVLFSVCLFLTSCISAGERHETLSLVSTSRSSVGYGVYVDDGNAYITNNDGIVVFDIQKPDRPRKVAEILTGGAFGICVGNGLAYILGKDGLVIADNSDPANPKKLGEHVCRGKTHRVRVYCSDKTQARANPESYEIQSQILGEKRVITVVLPESYDRSGKKYPVLFLLDAEWSVDMFNAVVMSMFEKDEIPELMIVGIRNINEDTRLRDLTPTPVEKYPGSGGSDKFLLFLAKEAIPFIEDKFRTTSPRILFGHSSGGLFTTYALVKNSDVFAGYIASSPGLSWDNELVLKRASQMFKENTDLNKFLYLGIGTEDYKTYMASTENFARILKSEAPLSLSWVYRVFEGEDHTTMPDKSFPDGLVWFFQKYKKRLQGLIS